VLAGDFLDVLNRQDIKWEIDHYLFAPLINLNLDGQSYPVLATEVPSPQNGRAITTENPDGTQRLEIKLTLRDDIKWSDGTPITTDDIQMYYDVGKAAGMPVTNPDYWSRVGLEVASEREFTVTFDPAYNTDLVGGPASPIGYAPAHIMRPAWEETKAQVAQIDPANAEAITEAYRAFFTQFSTPKALNEGKMVYSGAFKFERWVPGSSIDLVRNPEFHIIPPGGADKYVQKVSYQIIQNTNALLIGMISGTIDATANLGVTFDQARSPQLVSRMPGRFDIWFVPAPAVEMIQINQFAENDAKNHLGLNDPKTRQALIMAINRDMISAAFFSRLQPTANSWIAPQHPYYADVEGYPYNPDQARQLLAELGWQPGPDGILVRDGTRFELEFVTTAGNILRERVQQFIIQNLSDVGIAVRINNAPSSSLFVDEYMRHGSEGTWQGLLMYYDSATPKEDGIWFLCNDLLSGESFVPRAANNFNGAFNIGGWCNPEYDQLRAEAVLDFDPDSAARKFARMQELVVNEAAFIPLYIRVHPYVVRYGVANYVGSTYSAGRGFAPVEPWLVGWESQGAQKVFDQSKYGTRYGIPESTAR
jgi:peptide/nickel transport system substrate-binding protein